MGNVKGQPAYLACKEVCGILENPGVSLGETARVDFSNRPTTDDQARIETELDKMDLTGTRILHVGIGNSKLAQRFASRASQLDGISVSEAEVEHANQLELSNYKVHLLSKYSREFALRIGGDYDLIIDNNPASFACCKYHFFLMLDNYLGSLKPSGKILTDRQGLAWVPYDHRWKMSYEDLLDLETKFPLRVSKLSDMVFVLERHSVSRQNTNRARFF